MPHPTMDLSCLQQDPAGTEVTLTVWFATAILLEVSSKPDKSRNKKSRAPRIRVPNNERAVAVLTTHDSRHHAREQQQQDQN